MEGRKADRIPYIFAVTYRLLLCKAETEQVRQVQGESSTVQTYAAYDERVRDWFLTTFGQKTASSKILNRSTFLLSTSTRRYGAAKGILLQYVSKTTNALLLSHITTYVSECMQARRLYAKLQRKRESRSGIAMQRVSRARSALKKLVGLGNSETFYFPHSFYDRRTVLLHVILSRSDGF